ncbi:MAG: hypothetical protein KIT84_28245 [Labilithrix sp.]|nr:hypothetical protein [Labilithrix sp.]MCW5814950.1 hypothetical protein [Labilithrix sp.]
MMMGLAKTAVLGFAACFALLACEAEQPEAFQGPVKTGKSTKDKDKDDDKPSKGSTSTSSSDDDPEPSSTTQAQTTPVDAGPKFPDCTGTNTLQACLTCCDQGGVYQAFYTKAVACNFEPTCKNAASQECFANATCTNSDQCMAANGCWNKPDPEGDAE